MFKNVCLSILDTKMKLLSPISMQLPEKFKDLPHLHEWMTRPDPACIEAVKSLSGTLLILGAGGKMGASLAIMARRALEACENPVAVTAVSRFSNPDVQTHLQERGVRTIACDLMDEHQLAQLPDAAHVIFMAGTKFGTTGNEAQTWAINSFLPGLVARKYAQSRILVFSTGNVYPFVPVDSGGSKEEDLTAPIGEYAQSALGRERVFEYFSRRNETPILTFRLNYAIDMRYGVLLDIARKVYQGQTIDLHMGYVNVIWQGDANGYALKALRLAQSPPVILNVTGKEILSVRQLAHQFGEFFNRKPVFTGTEQKTALLSNASQCFEKLEGDPVSVEDMVRWTANWLLDNHHTYEKPTRFEIREGKF